MAILYLGCTGLIWGFENGIGCIVFSASGLEVINLESFSNLRYRAMIGCLWTRVLKQLIIALYFEFETVLKIYNLEARCQSLRLSILRSSKAYLSSPVY